MASPNTPAPSAASTTTTTPPPPTPGGGPPKNPNLRYVAMGVTPVAIAALFLPPRRLDARQLLLGGVAVWGVNHLAWEYSGRGFGERMNRTMASLTGSELPEGARRTQERLRAEREARDRRQLLARHPGLSEPEAAAMAEEDRRAREAAGRAAGPGAALRQLWMGDQPPDWRERREREEREALAEGGKGYWGLITDQVADVWKGGAAATKEGENQQQQQKGEQEEGAAAGDGKKDGVEKKKP